MEVIPIQHKSQKFTRRCISVLCTCLLILGVTGFSWAQNELYEESFIGSNNFYAQSSEQLNQLITVDFKDSPVLDALKETAGMAGLELNYNKNTLNTDVIITSEYKDMSVFDVLNDITAFASIFFYISDNGHLVLTPNEIPSDLGTLKGMILDGDNEEPLVGATAYIPELEMGGATNVNGEFEIDQIPSGTYTIQISNIGYQEITRTIQIEAEQELELIFVLEPDIEFLDQVVVTGYSVRQRSLPTGSINRIDGADFAETLIQSPDQALQGRSSGVLVTHTSGQPGSGLSVRVRGLGSISASNSPIYIVDGVQVRTDHTSNAVQDNALSTINPNDIESIEVLKDASSTAMYGAQGANGVVLITTRQAQRGQTQINVSTQVGFNAQPEKLDVMDGPTWTQTMIDGYVNYYVDRGEDPEIRRQMAIERYGDPATAPTYDWQEELTRAGALQKFNISAAAGLDNTRIRLSGSYDYEEGQVLASDFNSLRFRSNIDHSFSDRFTVLSRLSISSSTANGLRTGSANITSPFHGGYTQRPIDAIYTEDGGYNHNDVIRINLVQQLNEDIREARTRTLRGSLTGVYEISDNVSVRSLWGVDFRTVRDKRYISALLPRYMDAGGRLTERHRETIRFNTNQLVEFAESFAQHSVNLVGGFEYRADDRSSFRAYGEQFPNPNFTQLDLAADNFSISGRSTQSRFAGIFSRVDYNYDERYYVSGNIRYDGSSRFGEQNRWGLFYSGAFSWDVAKEAFMQNIGFLNQLKLNVSYGITGNSNISDFAARSLFGSGGNYEGNTGLRPSGLGNDILTWEEAQTLDLGVEFAVLNERFYADINWFNTQNKNLLLNAWLPIDSGFSSIARNSGVVENRGWEIELGARWITTNTFSWSSNFNFTYQENEILELVDGVDILGRSTRVGQPIDLLFHYDFAGVNPADGRVFWYDEDGHLSYRRSSSDRKPIGSYSPDFFGGLNNSFNYRNFALNVFFQYDYGRSTYNSTVGRRMHTVSTERGLINTVATSSWREPGDMTELPRPYISRSFPGSSSHYNSSVFIRDVSYIRLKEMRLNYSLPMEWTEKISLTNANIFVQGRNLLTWTNWEYGDPEFVGQGTGEYPQSRQFTIGINFQL